MIDSIPSSWRSAFADALADPSTAALEAWLDGERHEREILPPADAVFAALGLTPLESVRAVVLGQDPYPDPKLATGLAFSVQRHKPPPASLRNILAEWARDTQGTVPTDGCLEPWARHGVLLLNAVLTVERGKPGSHADRGWERLTGAILATVAAKPDPVVFFLWGARAQRTWDKRAQSTPMRADLTRHIVVRASHPSPRSARRPCGDTPAFVGSEPFRRANEELERRGQPPIDWSLGASEADRIQG